MVPNYNIEDENTHLSYLLEAYVFNSFGPIWFLVLKINSNFDNY